MTISNTFLALPAADLRVAEGANTGDGMDMFTDAVPEDRYRLAERAGPFHLTIEADPDEDGKLVAFATPDRRRTLVSLAGIATFMSLNDASAIECVIVVDRSRNREDIALWLIPTAPFEEAADYCLTDLRQDPAVARRLLSQLLAASFVAGTHLMSGDRTFVPVERFQPGDTVFTRDNGVQPIRWIGKRTLRAEGQFAPVTIAANTHGAHATVRLSPMHRLLAVHRGAAALGTPSHQLIAARNLVDGIRVIQTSGGYVDYYQVVLDNHEILFAEGVAVESQMPLGAFDTKLGGTTDQSARRRLQRQHEYAQAITRDLPPHIANRSG